MPRMNPRFVGLALPAGILKGAESAPEELVMSELAGIVGNRVDRREWDAMVASQHHRGPDAEGAYYAREMKTTCSL